jgi:hypothetical protein
MSPLNWSARDCLRRVGLLAIAAAGILSILATSGDGDESPSFVSPGGIWNGGFTATSGPDFGPAQALISETGKAHLILADGRTQFSAVFFDGNARFSRSTNSS